MKAPELPKALAFELPRLMLTVWPAFAPIWNWRSCPATALSAVALKVPRVLPRAELVERDSPLRPPVVKLNVLPSVLTVSLVWPLMVREPLAPAVTFAVAGTPVVAVELLRPAKLVVPPEAPAVWLVKVRAVVAWVTV